jgi:hypothetical protein
MRRLRGARARSAIYRLLTLLPIASWIVYFVDSDPPRSVEPPAFEDWILPLGLATALSVVGVHYLREAATKGRLGVVSYYLLFLWLNVFAIAYWEIGEHGFNRSLTRLDAAYLAMSVATTTGFGDLTPTSQLARGVVTAQMATGFVLVIFGLSSLASRSYGGSD